MKQILTTALIFFSVGVCLAGEKDDLEGFDYIRGKISGRSIISAGWAIFEEITGDAAEAMYYQLSAPMQEGGVCTFGQATKSFAGRLFCTKYHTFNIEQYRLDKCPANANPKISYDEQAQDECMINADPNETEKARYECFLGINLEKGSIGFSQYGDVCADADEELYANWDEIGNKMPIDSSSNWEPAPKEKYRKYQNGFNYIHGKINGRITVSSGWTTFDITGDAAQAMYYQLSAPVVKSAGCDPHGQTKSFPGLSCTKSGKNKNSTYECFIQVNLKKGTIGAHNMVCPDKKTDALWDSRGNKQPRSLNTPDLDDESPLVNNDDDSASKE
jgi:hypothetical protein